MSEQLTIETINEQPSAIEHETSTAIDVSKNDTQNADSINMKSIPLKKIAELTEREKITLYDASLHNQFMDYYDVKQFSNGNYRIIRIKQQSIAQKAIADNGQLNISTPTGLHKVYMSIDQLIWMHVLDLVNKYNKLYNKHQKLKKRYNDLYIEDIDESDQSPSPLHPSSQHEGVVSTATVNDEPLTQEQPTQQHEPSPEQLLYHTYLPFNWRARLINRNRF